MSTIIKNIKKNKESEKIKIFDLINQKTNHNHKTNNFFTNKIKLSINSHKRNFISLLEKNFKNIM